MSKEQAIELAKSILKGDKSPRFMEFFSQISTSQPCDDCACATNLYKLFGQIISDYNKSQEPTDDDIAAFKTFLIEPKNLANLNEQEITNESQRLFSFLTKQEQSQFIESIKDSYKKSALSDLYKLQKLIENPKITTPYAFFFTIIINERTTQNNHFKNQKEVIDIAKENPSSERVSELLEQVKKEYPSLNNIANYAKPSANISSTKTTTPKPKAAYRSEAF